MNDLIYALSTPVGGAIAVVRISGPGAGELLETVFTGRGKPREMVYGRIVDELGETLDEVMAVFFPARKCINSSFSIQRVRCIFVSVTVTVKEQVLQASITLKSKTEAL